MVQLPYRLAGWVVSAFSMLGLRLLIIIASLVEIKIRCFKLLGERGYARLFNSQVTELQIRRVALLNRFTQLGRLVAAVTP